jgi:hypothetical protein
MPWKCNQGLKLLHKRNVFLVTPITLLETKSKLCCTCCKNQRPHILLQCTINSKWNAKDTLELLYLKFRCLNWWLTLTIVPCARYFSSEVTLYVRGLLAMRILPFSYPTPSTTFPALGPSSELKTTTVLISSGKHSLEIWFSFLFLNSVSDPSGVSCHCGPPTWRPFAQP